LKFKAKEVRDLTGMSEPGPDDEVIGGDDPQQPGMMPGQPGETGVSPAGAVPPGPATGSDNPAAPSPASPGLEPETPMGDAGDGEPPGEPHPEAEALTLAMAKAADQGDEEAGAYLAELATDPDLLAEAMADGDTTAQYAKAPSASASRAEGDVWQGQSGRWFTKKNGRVVPSKAPGSSTPAAKPTGAAQPPKTSPKGTPKAAAGSKAAATKQVQSVGMAALQLAANNPSALTSADLAALPAQLNAMTVVQLKVFLKQISQSVTGKKADLADRLLRHAQGAVVSANTPASPPPPPAAPVPPPPAVSPPPPPPAAPQRPSPAAATGGPPGPPPRPGLVWDSTTHRWKLADGGVYGGYLKPGQKVTSSDRFGLFALVDQELAKQGLTATDAMNRGGTAKILSAIAGQTDGSVGTFEVTRALKNAAALEATTVIAPLFAVNGARNAPNLQLPGQSRPATLTRDEKVALQQYTSAVYRPLNDDLRNTGKPRDSLGTLHQNLQDAFAKAGQFAQPVSVVRGLTVDPSQMKQFLGQFQSGGAVTLPGYQSATVGTQLDQFFQGNVQLNIQASQGLDMSPLTHYAGAPAREMLLNHNSTFRVKGVRTVGGVTQIDLEQLTGSAAATAAASNAPAKPGFWSRLLSFGRKPAQATPTPTVTPVTVGPSAPLADVKATGISSQLRNLPVMQDLLKMDKTSQIVARDNANSWNQREDTFGSKLAASSGYDRPPQLVDGKAMDQLKQQGWLVGYRAVSDKKHHDQFRTGSLSVRTGLHGSGTYVAYSGFGSKLPTDDSARANAGNYGHEMTRFALPPTAKMVDETALKAEHADDLRALTREYAAGKISEKEYNAMQTLLADRGRYAMLKGYDAIKVSHRGHLVILNRGVTTVQKDNL
jgi:hypothetical protein